MKKQVTHPPAPVIRMRPDCQPLTKETRHRLFRFRDLTDEAAEELGPVVHQLVKILCKHLRRKKAKKK